MKGDERILSDSAFVNQILFEAEKNVGKRNHLKARRVNLGMVAQRVADSVGLKVQDVWSAGKYRKIVQVRSLFVSQNEKIAVKNILVFKICSLENHVYS